MFSFLKKKKTDPALYAPVDGKLIPLCEVPDTVFNSGMMGQGVGFIYSGSQVCAPASGTISVVAQTGHAVGMNADNGAEILIHIGLDTVALGGQGFTVKVKNGQRVKTGDVLVEIDRAFMAEKGIDLTTPMVITNSTEKPVTICAAQGASISKGSPVATVDA